MQKSFCSVDWYFKSCGFAIASSKIEVVVTLDVVESYFFVAILCVADDAIYSFLCAFPASSYRLNDSCPLYNVESSMLMLSQIGRAHV